MDKNIIEYKGYVAKVDYLPDTKELMATSVNIRDVITAVATDAHDLEREFQESVEVYLESCAEDNVDPERPFSGRFNVRMAPELHQKAVLLASSENRSLNDLIVDSLRARVE